MKGRASRAVYMRLQPSLLSPPSDPEEREKKKDKKKKGAKKNCTRCHARVDKHISWNGRCCGLESSCALIS